MLCASKKVADLLGFVAEFCHGATVFLSKSVEVLAHGFETSYTAKLYRILRRGHVGN